MRKWFNGRKKKLVCVLHPFSGCILYSIVSVYETSCLVAFRFNYLLCDDNLIDWQLNCYHLPYSQNCCFYRGYSTIMRYSRFQRWSSCMILYAKKKSLQMSIEYASNHNHNFCSQVPIIPSHSHHSNFVVTLFPERKGLPMETRVFLTEWPLFEHFRVTDVTDWFE